MDYVVISPVRNEAAFLRETIASLAAQSVLPKQWIVVNDGSTDETAAILRHAQSTIPFLDVLDRSDRGFRKSGTGVMEAFYDGFERIQHAGWQFLVKLDGDLKFDPTFFELIFRAFDSDKRLGIAGGEVLFERDGRLEIESRDPLFHVRGAAKVYRRECWDAIEGLIRTSGWDTVDEVKANMLGWSTRRIREARLLHLRPTGGADGTWKNAVKNGRGSYLSGYHPLFLLGRSFVRLARHLSVQEALGLTFGYFESAAKRVKRNVDGELLAYVQKQQMNRMLRRPSMWK